MNHSICKRVYCLYLDVSLCMIQFLQRYFSIRTVPDYIQYKECQECEPIEHCIIDIEST